MQRQAQDVHRRVEQVRRDAGGQQPDRAVGRDHAPVAVDDERGVGLVAGEHAVERLADGAHLGRLEVALAVGGRVAGGEQQAVALAQRHVEVLGEVHDELGARARAAGLDEAQMPRGDAGVQGEVELAEVPARAPVAQQRSDGGAVDDAVHRHGGVSPPAPPGRDGDAPSVSAPAARRRTR
jgi:hypothetical protein